MKYENIILDWDSECVNSLFFCFSQNSGESSLEEATVVVWMLSNRVVQ